MGENNSAHNKVVQVENGSDILLNLKSEGNYMGAVSPNFAIDSSDLALFGNLMMPNTPQMRVLKSPLHTLTNNMNTKVTQQPGHEGYDLESQNSSRAKRSYSEVEKEGALDAKSMQKPLNPDDIPMRTDYGTLEELLAEIGLPSTKATGLYDEDIKPPYSYAAMIALSIMVSGLGQLTLSQIYQWISSHFPFYKLGDSGWQNSIRHNLSLNSAFFKGGKSSDGKGHFWRLTPGQELKILKIQAKPSTKHKAKKSQLTVSNDTRKNHVASASISDSKQLSMINTTSSLQLMEPIKEDETLVSSSSSLEAKKLTFSKDTENSALRIGEDEAEGEAETFRAFKKTKHEFQFSEKYTDLLVTPIKYNFNSSHPSNHVGQSKEPLDAFKADFNTLRKMNEYDDFNSLMADGKFLDLEQSFQCSFNTTFDSPRLATNTSSSPLIEYHSRSQQKGQKIDNILQPKFSIGRTTTTLVETPKKEDFNEDSDGEKYGKITVGNVMLSRTPLKPGLSPFPTFSAINNHTGNHLSSALQKHTPRWKTPSYDDIFVSPFFKSPRSHHFSSSLFFTEHTTINSNNNNHINIELNRRHSTTDINTDAYKADGATAKKLEPALLDLKGSSNSDGYQSEKLSDTELDRDAS